MIFFYLSAQFQALPIRHNGVDHVFQQSLACKEWTIILEHNARSFVLKHISFWPGLQQVYFWGHVTFVDHTFWEPPAYKSNYS